MKIFLERSFKKDIARVPKNIQAAAERRVLLFIENPQHPLLHYHQLHGELSAYASINVTGNYRLAFRMEADVLFLSRIGTHAQLYE